MDDEARKWFRYLPAGSVVGIEALDEAFLKQWGDRKDYLYYITKFGSLKRKEGESLIDFTKCFNKVYQKIPAEVKPPKTTAMITFANTFDAKLSLWLRVAKPQSLPAMQEAAIEVESNILEANKLKAKEIKGAKEKKKQKDEKQPSTSKDSSTDKKLDEMSNLMKHLASKMSKLEVENRPAVRPPPDVLNRNLMPFRRPCPPQQILQRDRRNLDDQRIQPPLNNYVDENEQSLLEEQEEIN